MQRLRPKIFSLIFISSIYHDHVVFRGNLCGRKDTIDWNTRVSEFQFPRYSRDSRITEEAVEWYYS